MGCTICQKTYYRSFYFVHKEETKVSYRTDLKKNDQVICMKIEIQPCLHPILTRNLQRTPSLYRYIQNYLQYIDQVKYIYSSLESSENHLKLKTHSVCLGPKLENCIKVLLISVTAASKGQNQINLINNFPFFSLSQELTSEGTLQIYRAWNEYCDVLDKIMNPGDITLRLHECTKRLKELLSDYSLHQECFVNVDFGLFKDFLKSVIGLAEFLDKKVKKNVLKIRNYFMNLKNFEGEIKIFGCKACQLEVFAGKEIVHLVLKRVCM